MFLGLILISGAGSWLESVSITHNDTLSAGNYNYTDISTTNTTSWDVVKYVFQNPFSPISYLAWISVAILITNIYIIVTSVIP